MILGFKDRFIPFLLDGSKTHTIRAGYRWKEGMRADCYGRPRQKNMRLVFRAPVSRVEPIEIFEYESVQSGRGPIAPLSGNHIENAHRGPSGESLLIRIDGVLLEADEARTLMRRDGFRDLTCCPQYEALQFWQQRLPFRGQLIHWDYEKKFSGAL